MMPDNHPSVNEAAKKALEHLSKLSADELLQRFEEPTGDVGQFITDTSPKENLIKTPLGEKEILGVCEKYFYMNTPVTMVKKLGEELVELAMAIQEDNVEHIHEEIGDCAAILVHILSKFPKKYGDNASLDYLLFMTSLKLEHRHSEKK